MSELKTAIDIIGIIFELFFSSAFFDYIFNKTFKSKKIFFSLLYVLILCTGVFIPKIKNFAPIISLLATFVLSLSYNSKIISKMIYSTMLFLSFIMSEMVIGLVMSSILRLPVEKIIDNLYFYACGVLFSKFIIYIILKLIIEIKNKDVNTSLLSRIPKFFILPISTLYTVLIIFYLS